MAELNDMSDLNLVSMEEVNRRLEALNCCSDDLVGSELKLCLEKLDSRKTELRQQAETMDRRRTIVEKYSMKEIRSVRVGELKSKRKMSDAVSQEFEKFPSQFSNEKLSAVVSQGLDDFPIKYDFQQ